MQTDPYATAADLGIMQGFPPPLDRRVTRRNALMTPPFNRWSYQHMRTVYPSAPIGPATTSIDLEATGDVPLTDLTVTGAEGQVLGFAEYLRRTYTDALVVTTRDRIVHETYLNGMTGHQPHQMMSVTKSFAGLLALVAVSEGQISESDPVTAVVPELAPATAFEGATLGHVLDMVNSMDFSEDYADPHSGIIRYGRTLGWLESAADDLPADNLYDFLATLSRDPAYHHGEIFHYQTPKTDVVNWVTNRVTGASFQQAMTDRLWSMIGAEGETYVLLDRNGTLVAGGGLNASPRNLARFAIMMAGNGEFAGRRVLPASVIDTIARGASRAAFAAGPDATGAFGGGDWSYRAQWWVRHTDGREAFTAMGVHGQFIYVDRDRGVAIVKQSSQPISLDEQLDRINIDMFDAIIDRVSQM